MRSEIYKKVSAALFRIARDGHVMSEEEKESGTESLIKYVDLWNRNVEFIEQEVQWPMPAVFIEFGKIGWNAVKEGKLRCHSQIILHIVTSWEASASSASVMRDEALGVLDYSEQILGVMKGLHGESFCNMTLVETNTNHNHEEIMENLDVYEYVGEAG
jgi:hypothetical protein